MKKKEYQLLKQHGWDAYKYCDIEDVTFNYLTNRRKTGYAPDKCVRLYGLLEKIKIHKNSMLADVITNIYTTAYFDAEDEYQKYFTYKLCPRDFLGQKGGNKVLSRIRMFVKKQHNDLCKKQ